MHPVPVQVVPHVAGAQVLDGGAGGHAEGEQPGGRHHILHRFGDGAVHGGLGVFVILFIVGPEGVAGRGNPFGVLHIGPGHVPAEFQAIGGRLGMVSLVDAPDPLGQQVHIGGPLTGHGDRRRGGGVLLALGGGDGDDRCPAALEGHGARRVHAGHSRVRGLVAQVGVGLRLKGEAPAHPGRGGLTGNRLGTKRLSLALDDGGLLLRCLRYALLRHLGREDLLRLLGHGLLLGFLRLCRLRGHCLRLGGLGGLCRVLSPEGPIIGPGRQVRLILLRPVGRLIRRLVLRGLPGHLFGVGAGFHRVLRLLRALRPVLRRPGDLGGGGVLCPLGAFRHGGVLRFHGAVSGRDALRLLRAVRRGGVFRLRGAVGQVFRLLPAVPLCPTAQGMEGVSPGRGAQEGGLHLGGLRVRNLHLGAPLVRPIGCRPAGEDAGLLEGHDIPLLVPQGVLDGLILLDLHGAFVFLVEGVIGVLRLSLAQVVPVGGQSAGGNIEVADGHVVSGALRHLIQILQTVHAEAVAHGQQTQLLSLLNQAAGRRLRPEARRQQRQGQGKRQQQGGQPSYCPYHSFRSFPVFLLFVFQIIVNFTPLLY